jgi:hypothetical protein
VALCLALAAAAAAGPGAAAASAQAPPPLELSPNVAGQGTALVLAADGAILSPDGRTPGSIALGLARGGRFDPDRKRGV